MAPPVTPPPEDVKEVINVEYRRLLVPLAEGSSLLKKN